MRWKIEVIFYRYYEAMVNGITVSVPMTADMLQLA